MVIWLSSGRLVVVFGPRCITGPRPRLRGFEESEPTCRRPLLGDGVSGAGSPHVPGRPEEEHHMGNSASSLLVFLAGLLGMAVVEIGAEELSSFCFQRMARR